MSVEVFLTPRARQQVSALRVVDRRAYDELLTGLRAQGCGALHYRLSGEGLVERLCVVRLRGPLRVVVAFTSPTAVTILLVAPHADGDPFVDVYTQPYALAGLEHPPAGGRRKPPCCGDDALPPVLSVELVDDLVRRARELAGADKRRARRQGR